MEPIGLSLALGCLIEGLRTLYSVNPLKQRMEMLEKTKNFDLDYLPSLDGVPREKPICLRGYLESVAGQRDQPAEYSSPLDPSEKLAVGKVIWQPPQRAVQKVPAKGASADPEFDDTASIGEADGTNYLATLDGCPQDRSMYLTNDKSELILLVWRDRLLLHNTSLVFAPGNEQSLSYAYRPSLFKDHRAWLNWNFKRRLLADKGRVVELGLKRGESYNFVGSISSYNGQHANPRGAKLMMHSSIVTGEMKEVIMRAIDNQIQHGVQRSRYCLVGCFAVSSAVLLYRKVVIPAQAEEKIQRAQRAARK